MKTTGDMLRRVAGIVTIALAAAGLATPARAASPVIIWCDNTRAPIMKVWAQTAGYGSDVQVVGQTDLRSALKTVPAGSAPDIIIGAHDWIGAMKANSTIVPVVLPATAKFAPAVKAAFQIGGKQYGVPLATENVALFRNTRLVPKAPATFAELEKVALALKAKNKSNRSFVPFAIPQGAGGDAYHMYPLFSGLGGYFFGGSPTAWNTRDVGVDSKRLIANSSLVDKWYSEGLIKSSVSADVAKSAFVSGNAPFYITGPWNLGSIRASGVPYAISSFPTIVKGIKPVPLLGVQGAMLTSFSSKHGNLTQARKILSAMAGKDAQLFMSNMLLRAPANLDALKSYNRPGASEFQAAGVGGLPMPGIMAMNAVWASVGIAWVKATSGSSKAAAAFKAAAATVRRAV